MKNYVVIVVSGNGFSCASPVFSRTNPEARLVFRTVQDTLRATNARAILFLVENNQRTGIRTILRTESVGTVTLSEVNEASWVFGLGNSPQSYQQLTQHH